jgi:predicted transcriptional regulator
MASFPKRDRVRSDLTAVTLGELLKDDLDRVADATGENRSKIIRDALERYIAELPQLRAHRAEVRATVHDRAFLIVVGRVLAAFDLLLSQTFDFGEVFPVELDTSLRGALGDFRQWLAPRVPEGARLSEEIPESVAEALFEIERGSRRMWRSPETKWWKESVARWSKQFVREKTEPGATCLRPLRDRELIDVPSKGNAKKMERGK